MARYKSDQPVYLSNEGRYIMVGEEFQSDHVPGISWQPLDKAAKAAVATRDEAEKANVAVQGNAATGVDVNVLAAALKKLIDQAEPVTPDEPGDDAGNGRDVGGEQQS